MKVEYDDKEYDLELDEMTIGQARTIKAATGCTVMALQRGMMEADPDALVGLYWLMMTQSDIKVNIKTIDFKVAAFANALADAVVNSLTPEQREELEEATGVTLDKKTEDEVPKST